ncbi:HlyD family efflux transporter periplasmic adaptor subunit [Sphingobacterium oryzagri]|uniref:HlyD family efflux transporter periplasmic adaptor subunit n=1 Tax=Sphingobacterium oryzagri TaxID=3025669 RepID=A0ABY7WD13_9SPHI|nr:HlyD family efflux transporter periplasmic adaptor subunit [Sphingobacterium sp. KACC 22765]WDF67546.1 HlyD family efflux transporter periplasmic adaptor subunit [Sphingobacterium sp. KACC 22765]
MKLFINKYPFLLIALVGLLYAACKQSGKPQQDTETTETMLAKVNTVVAIGKVVPANGYEWLASPVSGLVKEVMVKEGDHVDAGEVVIKLSEQTAPLAVDLSKVQLERMLAQNKSSQSSIQEEQLKLAELREKYETSHTLYAKNAETREKMQADSNAWKQQEQRLLSVQQDIKATAVDQKAQRINIRKAEEDYQALQVRASGSGTIVELLAEVGQSVTPSTTLGRVANTDSLLVEAEVDELFVDRVNIGQSVSFFAVGSKRAVGTGKIVYVSPTLMDKSMLYESANEGDDRRVRRLKIKPDRSDGLLINAKVDCQINIQ